MKKHTVYQIIYIPTGEICYIGSTSNYKERCRGHRKPSSRQYVDRLMHRVGLDSFEMRIVRSFDKKEQALELEGVLCSQNKPRLNKTNTGQSGYSNKILPKTRRKRSESSKGMKHTAETKRKISAANKGRKRPDLAEWNRQNNSSGRDHPSFGKTRTPETRQKMSESSKHKCWQHADEIVRLKQQGWTYRKLAEKYGCSTGPIENILKANKENNLC